MGAAQKVAKEEWVSRSPRYKVKEDKEAPVRFSRGGSRRKIAKTRVINLSDTGMAFFVDGRAVPHLGEIIRIEIELEGWVERFGRVVRLESPKEGDAVREIQVAVEFLPESADVRKSLGLKFNRAWTVLDRMQKAENLASARGLLYVSGGLLVMAFLGLAMS